MHKYYNTFFLVGRYLPKHSHVVCLVESHQVQLWQQMRTVELINCAN